MNLQAAQKRADRILKQDGLVCMWDFQEEGGGMRVSKGRYAYGLQEMAGPVLRVEDGVLGPYAAKVDFGQWFSLPRSECPELNFHGGRSGLTVAAWVKREARENPECQAVAGMWNESRRMRQYCLFLDLKIWDSQDQVCGHVSSVGGPTPGYGYCMTAAIGRTPVRKGEWHFAAFSYDGKVARCYLDGRLDERETYNPYGYDEALFDGEEDGADFTVCSVDRSGEPGNFFSGLLGGLAVFDRALTEEEIRELYL